ncbi:ABC transporter ATP-binding protein [Microtetraspora sp. NBRC 13810]|nr:ABC transporter ATP-binding protein [Microtetraspora sp. NBRC 13810]
MTSRMAVGGGLTPRVLVVRALWRRPRLVGRLLGWSVVEAAPGFAAGHAVARAVDDGFAAGDVGAGLGWLALLGGLWALAGVGARQSLLTIGAVVEPFRDALARYVVAGALHRAGSGGAEGDGAVGRLNHQVELARDSLAAVISVVRSFLFALVSVVLGLLTLVPEVLGPVLVPYVAGLVLFALSLPALARRQRELILADERTAATVSGIAAGLRDIVACGAEDRAAALAERDVARQAAAALGLARLTAARTALLAVAGGLPVLCVLWATPWLVASGATAGILLGALTYVAKSLVPAFGALVHGVGVSGVRLRVSLARILATSGTPEPGPRPVAPRGVAVELRRAVFAYGPGAHPVIDGLDLRIPEGDHLAVVGPSGIGKSTLAGLVAGLLPPDAGEALVGGVPATLAERGARVLIPQEAYVFRGSLAANLAYYTTSAPGPRRMAEAVAAVGAADLVRRLGGYHADVDPTVLSAGERQLVALVRAYLSPARLVILDEATCHLDPAAEARAEAAFAARGGTLVVIAHRISSARRARRILVMDGTRVRSGTHETLVADSPLYAALTGHWTGAEPPGSPSGPAAEDAHGVPVLLPQPARLAGDPDRLDPGARAHLGEHP